MNKEIIGETQCKNVINWDAVFAGAITAIVIGSAFNVLGIGLGLLTIDVSVNKAGYYSTGAIFWVALSTVLYSFAGGWIATYFSQVKEIRAGMLQAFIAWGLATIFTAIVVSTSAGAMLSTTGQAANNAMQVTSQKKHILSSADTHDKYSNNATNVTSIQAIEQDKQLTEQEIEQSARVTGSLAIITFITLIIGAAISLLAGYYAIYQAQ